MTSETPAPRTTKVTAKTPIGTPVLAWPGTRDESPAVTRIRSTIWYIGSVPVVSVEGIAGGIALTHVEVLPTPPADECRAEGRGA